MRFDLSRLSQEKPILIAGPTASGKSALALEIADRLGGVIINADAIQVYDNWRVLTARPSPQDEAVASHALYGHVPYDYAYSVGHWLRDLDPYLGAGPRPIIIGGTGLYFLALTQGLAPIPQTPAETRKAGTAFLQTNGLQAMVAQLDARTRGQIDLANPMRVQRAWEVLQTTGRGLAEWQAETPAPRLPLDTTHAMCFDVDKDWLNTRIAQRFEQMIDQGALDEARANLPYWDPDLPSAKAIGAPELMSFLAGEISLETAKDRATIATRQFAKRQRTWFRARMRNWTPIRQEDMA